MSDVREVSKTMSGMDSESVASLASLDCSDCWDSSGESPRSMVGVDGGLCHLSFLATCLSREACSGVADARASWRKSCGPSILPALETARVTRRLGSGIGGGIAMGGGAAATAGGAGLGSWFGRPAISNVNRCGELVEELSGCDFTLVDVFGVGGGLVGGSDLFTESGMGVEVVVFCTIGVIGKLSSGWLGFQSAHRTSRV